MLAMACLVASLRTALVTFVGAYVFAANIGSERDQASRAR